MKLLAAVLFASTTLSACDKPPTKLDGKATAAASGGNASSGDHGKLIESLRKIDERLRALETAHTPTAASGQLSVGERMHRIEASLSRRDESLRFLDMAFAQQKRQEEMKEAKEMDPTGVYAVDISKAIAAGQVEGPNSAIVTVVEAWDFA